MKSWARYFVVLLIAAFTFATLVPGDYTNVMSVKMALAAVSGTAPNAVPMDHADCQNCDDGAGKTGMACEQGCTAAVMGIITTAATIRAKVSAGVVASFADRATGRAPLPDPAPPRSALI